MTNAPKLAFARYPPRGPFAYGPAEPGRVGVLLLAGGVLPWCAQAQSSPYFLGVSQTFGSDDNLLRLGENDVAPEGYAKADTFSTSTLLAGFNQGIGRQRVFANLSLRDTRYSRNDIFNNQGYSLRSGLEWATVERLSGGVNLSASRNLQRFGSAEIGFLREKNLETVRTLSTRVSLGLVTEYSLELSGGRTEVSNSLQQPTSRRTTPAWACAGAPAATPRWACRWAAHAGATRSSASRPTASRRLPGRPLQA